jgi:Carboxypeptidase regulatory-like domain
MRFPVVVCLFVCFAVICVPLFAQSPDGNINGLISDPSSAAVVGAEIVAVNDVTGVQYRTKTNAEGIYVLPNLPPGPYRVQVSKIGFKTLIKPDIVLNVQDSLSINFTLLIGAFHEIVTVQGGAPLVNSENATVSTVVDRQFAENLPMNGRSFQTLIDLTPGVVVTATSSTENGQFSVNGQRTESNYWMVDGVSANIGIGALSSTPGNGVGGTLGAFSALGGTNSLVSVDAMQEFRVQTSTYAPEFGRTPGGQISIATRSGTNRWHGTIFDYLRNDVFDASNWFNGYTNVPPLPKAKERQNDFGGTFSGPILKDTTFFFFSYEGLRLRLPETALTDVPDQLAREEAIPAMQPYLRAYPIPAPNKQDISPGIAPFNASYSNPASLDAYSLRLDHRLRERWSLFGRYNYSPSSFVDRGGSCGCAALNVENPFKVNTQTLTVGVTWSVSPTLVNDSRFNYSRVNAQSYYAMDSFGGGAPLATLPFPAGFGAQNGLFNSYLFALPAGEAILVGQGANNTQHQTNFVDGLAWQKGAHSLKFGMDFRRLTPQLNAPEYDQLVTFNSISDATGGNSSLGLVGSQRELTLLFRNLSLYAQDAWRITPNLTVTYGSRWDVDFVPHSIQGPAIPAVTGYNLTNFAAMAIAPAGTPPFNTRYANFAPRIGAAYLIPGRRTWQTVLRGGAGIFYDLASAETGELAGVAQPPFGESQVFFGAPFPFSAAQAPPIPGASLGQLFVFNPHLRLPYTIEWNAAIEQSIGRDQALSISYVGSAGRRLLQVTAVEDPPTNPNINSGIFVDNTGTSSYQALQVQLHRRLSGGLQALASYSWAHSIDDGSAGYSSVSSYNSLGNSAQNRGNSDFDIRNSFTAGLTYDVPTFGTRRFARHVLGGWSAESFILARSSPPVDIDDTNFFELNGGIQVNIRPDVVPGEPFYLNGSQFPGGRAFNPAAFTNPPIDPETNNPTRQGTLARNTLRAFGATQWDFAVHRTLAVHESLNLQFRAEMFNVLNHPNFGPQDNAFGTGGFGIATEMLAQSLSNQSLGGGGFSPLYQIGGPRSIQLGLKFVF